ncbi:MAG: BMP family protein [Actinobacteria bacterium]|nr:BMP family protein [Actinomycetota bacterium]
MKKVMLLLLIVIFAASMLFVGIGCKTGQVTETTAVETTAAETTAAETTVAETTAAETTAAQKIKMAIGTVSWKTDGSWGQSMEEASKYIQDKYPNVEVNFTDAIPFGDINKYLELQCQNGVKLIFLDSNSTWFTALEEIAPKYPDTWFVTGGGGLEDNKKLANNVTVYMVSQEEGEFLAGIATAMMTKSKKIGFVSAFDYPAIVANMKAWEQGALYVDPSIKLSYAWTGVWGDAEKHYETVKAVLDKGVDVLNHDLDSLGFLKAAQEKKTWIIGAHRDQSDLDPALFLTSALILHNQMAELSLQKFMDGTISKEGGKFGLKDGYDTLAPLTNVPDEVVTKVEEAKEKIISGEIKVELVFAVEK